MNMNIAFVVNGLGEYSQAFPIAKYFLENDHEVTFFVTNSFLAKIITNDGFHLLHIKQSKDIHLRLEKFVGEALFLCNSHTTYLYNLTRTKGIKKVFSLDSNWLFNNQKYRNYQTYKWIDTNYVVFPNEFFLKNIKQNGGYYEIDPFFADKIYNPGFIPSGIKLTKESRINKRRSLGIKDNEKLMISYLGSSHYFPKQFIYLGQNLIRKIKAFIDLQAIKLNTQIKLVNLSDDHLSLHNQIVRKTEQFDEIIACADMVIMHHGYGTFPKIFNNQIPVICFTRKPRNLIHHPFYELKPCIDTGIISHFFFEDYSEKDLFEKIIIYLFDYKAIEDMKSKQKNIFVPGEKNLLDHFYRQF